MALLGQPKEGKRSMNEQAFIKGDLVRVKETFYDLSYRGLVGKVTQISRRGKVIIKGRWIFDPNDLERIQEVASSPKKGGESKWTTE